MSQLSALLLTLSVEVPLYLLVAWMWRSRVEASLGTVALVAAAASLVTHPFAWYLNEALSSIMEFWLRAALIEAAVIVAEAAILAAFARMAWRTAFVASFIANMSSFGVGLFWFYFLR